MPLERAGTAHAAFRPLDPTLIAQCFSLIGRRPVACSAIVLRLALREGRPISRARLLFYPAIRVDSPTSPAVACSVRRQLSREITGARAHRSPLLSLAVLSYLAGVLVRSRRPDSIKRLGSGPSPFFFYVGLRHRLTRASRRSDSRFLSRLSFVRADRFFST